MLFFFSQWPVSRPWSIVMITSMKSAVLLEKGIWNGVCHSIHGKGYGIVCAIVYMEREHHWDSADRGYRCVSKAPYRCVSKAPNSATDLAVLIQLLSYSTQMTGPDDKQADSTPSHSTEHSSPAHVAVLMRFHLHSPW